jgi:hypothetical protein
MELGSAYDNRGLIQEIWNKIRCDCILVRSRIHTYPYRVCDEIPALYQGKLNHRTMLQVVKRKLLGKILNRAFARRFGIFRLFDVLLRNIPRGDVGLLENILTGLDVAQVKVEDRIRQVELSGRTISSCRGPIQTWLMENGAPWRKIPINPTVMPGMISNEEAQYYEYIGELYKGRGEVIELGPWLGKSTRHIIRGLRKNPHFVDRQLHVFDDFIWRSGWMDRHTPQHLRPPNHADFRPIFELFVQDILPDLTVKRARIADYDGNEHLTRIKWDGRPIEMMYIDCGRTTQVNEGWFEIFSPSFIPDVTLLILQDWRTHRERPRSPYNQTLSFTNAHPEIELIHEVLDGGIATFLYRRKLA